MKWRKLKNIELTTDVQTIIFITRDKHDIIIDLSSYELHPGFSVDSVAQW